MRRTAHIGLSLAAVLTLFITSAAGASAHPGGAVYMKTVKQAHGGGKPRSGSNLFSHGGLIEPTAKVFIVYWGPEWQAGFTATHGSFTYTSAAVQNYVNTFFTNVGGSPWAGVQTQYCQGIMAPAFSCTGQAGAAFITNPMGQLKGTWTDPSAVPADIVATGLASNLTTDPLEAEAIKASQHFGYDQNATYFILTPPGHSATAYGTVYCAYHSETGHSTSAGVRSS